MNRLLAFIVAIFLLVPFIACSQSPASITSPVPSSPIEVALPASSPTIIPTLVPSIVLSPTPSQTVPAPPAGGMNQRIVVDGIALTANSVRANARINEYISPSQGSSFLIVDVAIENVGREKVAVTQFDFKVRDSDGYEHNVGLVGDGKSLKSGDLLKGEMVRGTLAFQVPLEARGFTMIYRPLSLLTGYAGIRVRLE